MTSRIPPAAASATPSAQNLGTQRDLISRPVAPLAELATRI